MFRFDPSISVSRVSFPSQSLLSCLLSSTQLPHVMSNITESDGGVPVPTDVVDDDDDDDQDVTRPNLWFRDQQLILY